MRDTRSAILAVILMTIMVGSLVTINDPFLLMKAEAQGLQLRVSGAEFPQYENHFYGAQIIEIIIDDPGATDPDESTIRLQVRGETVPRVHLSDGLWYQYTAEEDFFGIYLDLLTDGVRDNNIAVVSATPTPANVKIGAETFTVSTDPTSFVREITVGPGGFRFVEVQQNNLGLAKGLFPTLPQPFFEICATTLNPDLELSVKPPSLIDGDGLCEPAEFDLPNTDCDWPYIRVIPLNQREQLVIRAGSASVELTFDEFPQSITTSLNRVSYPKDAEIMYKFDDFQWNINPQEVDQLFMVLNKDTGFIEKILNSPRGGIKKQNVLPIFPDLDFDHRQILESDDEGVESIAWVFAFSKSLDREVNFVPDSPPFVLVRENARLTSEFDGIDTVFAPGSSVPIDISTAQPGDLSPVVRINEASAKPNSGSFNTGQAGKGSRTTMFAGARDAVASLDYFDIITSAPMAVHDGFTSVDREVYDSADRSVFTITDQDQNLRSSVSESPDGRDAKNIIRVGDPIPFVNTRSATDPGGIFDPDLNNILQIWEAIFLSADGDTLLFGLNDIGANVLVDLNDDDVVDIDTITGTERFHAAEDDIQAVSGDDAFDLPIDNNKFATVFTADLIGLDNPNSIIIDSTVTIDDINETQFSTTATKAQILGQVRVNNLQEFGGSFLDSQEENFVTQVARITRSTGEVIGRDVALGLLGVGPIADDELLTVDMPRYNLLHVDAQRLLTTTGIEQIVAKIDAVDPACMIDGGIDTTVAFDEDCVHASQIVDFQIKERDNRDTDGDPLTGDDYDAPSPGVIGPGDPWDPLTGSAAIGFDRDPTTNRISIGVFRALDFEDHPAVNPDDQIRITILLFESDDDSGEIEPAEIISAVSQIMLVDIIGLGVVFAPSPTDEKPDDIGSPIGATFSNVAYRLQLREEGSNSSIFSGRADFLTFRVFDTVSDVLDTVVITGDPVKVWLPNRFIPPNRLAFTYFDADIVEFFREVTATFIYETRDGAIEWDRSSFSFGQDAFLTIKDEDLNRRPDSQERYDLPVDSFVFFELGKERVCSETDPAVSGIPDGAASCAPGNADSFFNNIDATLLETGTNTGTFVAQITMPRSILLDESPGSPGTPPESVITQQRDLEANYIDIRDRSSITQEFDDITNIRTELGIVILDRNVYPQGPRLPPNDPLLGAIMYISVVEPEGNTNPDIRDTLDLTSTVDFSPKTGKNNDIRDILEIKIFNGDGTDPVIYSANPESSILAGGNAFPLLDRRTSEVTTAQETGPNTGIFELEYMIYCPDSTPLQPLLPEPICTDTLFKGALQGVGISDPPTFNPQSLVPLVPIPPLTFKPNSRIQVTFNDPSDESGEPQDDHNFAIIQGVTGAVPGDGFEVNVGDTAPAIIIDSDFNFDSRAVEFANFNFLFFNTDKFPFPIPMGFGIIVMKALKLFTTTEVGFRENDKNSDIFGITLEGGAISTLTASRGSILEFIYFDFTPSGGGNRIRIESDIILNANLPEILFDKEEYTPFDELSLTIISPDSNSDKFQIDSITPLISTSTDKGINLRMAETAQDTGIFKKDINLSPNRSKFSGDLTAQREDDLTVEFRIDAKTVVTRSVFINYHVGNIMFDKDASRVDERRIIRVVDPDENMNPDTIDTIGIRIWSNTDRGGLFVTLRETGDRTGIFEEYITFTIDEESSGTRLRVSEGDTLVAKYTDKTLPAPAALDGDGLFTVEIEELFASSLIGSAKPLLERAIVEEPQLVDQIGMSIDHVTVDMQVLVQSEITNNQDIKQEFVYLVQVKDVEGFTTSLSWLNGELPQKDSILVTQSWIPEKMGRYEIEVFAWENMYNPVPVSPIRYLEVNVE